MSNLVLIHVVTGLAGIASGLVVIVGTFFRRRMPRWNALFLAATASACCTGLVFLPTSGVTSAQVVAVFCTLLVAIAAHARYVRRLQGGWGAVYAVTASYALTLNVLIATAQSFLHVPFLAAIAPTQASPVFIAIKVALLSACLATAFVFARRVGRQAVR